MKKLISLLTSITLCFGAMSNAVLTGIADNQEVRFGGTMDRDSEQYSSIMANYTEIDDSGVLRDWGHYPERENAPEYKVYAHKDGGVYIYEASMCHVFEFVLTEISDINETDLYIKELIAEYDSSYYYYYYQNDNGNYVYTVYSRTQTSKVLVDARDIYAELNEKNMISEFYYGHNLNNWTYVYTDGGLLSFYLSDKEVLEEYIAEHQIDAEVVDVSDNLCRIICNSEMSEEEKFKLANQIENDTEVHCYFYSLDLAYPFFVDTYDLFETNFGDLTLDNALTPVDASMLLSYYADAQSGVAVASAESGADYSVLGDFNGDGAVTPSDASEILSYYADQQTA
ncbi:MAG: hypothetical protein E7500_07260 [Ruminococcus sp.]|nr:hypothetical protein [Ruminococcus sp.]